MKAMSSRLNKQYTCVPGALWSVTGVQLRRHITNSINYHSSEDTIRTLKDMVFQELYILYGLVEHGMHDDA